MEATTEVTTPALILPETELIKINATDSALKQLIDRATSYATLPEVTDRDTYEEIHKFVMVAVKVRTNALALAKTLAEPHQRKADAIMAEGKRIGEMARQAENLTRPLKEAYEAEQERQRMEKERAAAAKLQERIQTIINLGMAWTGTGYELGPHLIDSVDIKAAPDEKWDTLIAEVTSYRQEEQARIQREQAEAEAQRQQRQAQLDAQRKEQEAAQVEIRRQQQEIRAQQEALAAEQRRIAKQAADLQAQKEKEEADRLAELERQQAEADAQARAKAEAEKLKAKQKADRERTKRLAPEKKALLKHIGFVRDLAQPMLEQPEAVAVLAVFHNKLQELADEFTLMIENL